MVIGNYSPRELFVRVWELAMEVVFSLKTSLFYWFILFVNYLNSFQVDMEIIQSNGRFFNNPILLFELILTFKSARIDVVAGNWTLGAWKGRKYFGVARRTKLFERLGSLHLYFRKPIFILFIDLVAIILNLLLYLLLLFVILLFLFRSYITEFFLTFHFQPLLMMRPIIFSSLNIFLQDILELLKLLKSVAFGIPWNFFWNIVNSSVYWLLWRSLWNCIMRFRRL